MEEGREVEKSGEKGGDVKANAILSESGKKWLEIGIDEAGRGPVLGSMFVAGVLNFENLANLGVKDSKKLSCWRRERLARIIEAKTIVYVAEISAEQIDKEREKGRTMNEITLNLASEVVNFFVRKTVKPLRVFVDAADVKPARFAERLRRACDKGCDLEIVAEWKADERYPVVSAASIVAKVHRDRSMREIARSIGEEIGSGYPSDPKTIAFLRNVLRRGEIPPFVRKSWKTLRRLQKH